MELKDITLFLSDLGVLAGAIAAAVVWIRKLVNGMKCQLRSEMLVIYYRNRAEGEIRQYEYENFVLLYESYKALKGNSFIDKIYEDVQEWKVIS